MCAGDAEQADDGSADFDIWRDNLQSLEAYVACATQWRWLVGRSWVMRVGLDYAGVKALLWSLNVADPQQVFNDVRAMEAAALEVFNAGD